MGFGHSILVGLVDLLRLGALLARETEEINHYAKWPMFDFFQGNQQGIGNLLHFSRPLCNAQLFEQLNQFARPPLWFLNVARGGGFKDIWHPQGEAGEHRTDPAAGVDQMFVVSVPFSGASSKMML